MINNSTYSASFDCAKTKSAIEKSICVNPKASKLDEELSALYQQTIARLQPEAQKNLYYGQLQWLQNLAEKKLPREIINAYQQRIAEIKQLAPMLVKHNTQKEQVAAQSDYNIYTIKNNNISYQQINSKDGVSAKINALVKQLVKEIIAGVVVLDDLTITIKAISNNIIRIELLCNYSGGAHPDYVREDYYFDRRTGRALTTSDCFNFTNLRYITAALLQRMHNNYTKEEQDCFMDTDAARIAGVLQHLKEVSLDKQTVSVNLGLCRACRSLELVTITTDEIKPFMSNFLRTELGLG